jgi:hypothetical protein
MKESDHVIMGLCQNPHYTSHTPLPPFPLSRGRVGCAFPWLEEKCFGYGILDWNGGGV